MFFLPLARVLAAAVQGQDGALSPSALVSRLTAEKIWTLACLTSTRSCGVAWNTVVLALLTATGTTLLGLALALLVTRTALPAAAPDAPPHRAARDHAAVRDRARASS